MGLEVLVLGVISGLRPATSQAAVFALLRPRQPPARCWRSRSPGSSSSVTIGLIVILAFGGVGWRVGRSTFSAVFDLFAGVASLGFAAGVARGGLPRGAGAELGARPPRSPSGCAIPRARRPRSPASPPTSRA